ncbi:MAG: GIY-YIG nuclease family protein [Nitrospiraceae bacterium]|nr:GIY-YIG nuclease family protein [Nitrospiraceae bacterium]
MANAGYIYVIQLGEHGPIKIGHSQNPKKRVDLLQVGAAERIYVRAITPGSVADEKALHKKYSEYRLRGEWFQPADDMLLEVLSREQVDVSAITPLHRVRRPVLSVDEAREIWMDKSIKQMEALKHMPGWTWQKAREAFGYRNGSTSPTFRKGQPPELAREYGSKGGKAKAAATAAARTSKTEALAAWRDLSLTAAEALATPAMDGWSTRAAYRELGKRNTARGVKIGRPKSKV